MLTHFNLQHDTNSLALWGHRWWHIQLSVCHRLASWMNPDIICDTYQLTAWRKLTGWLDPARTSTVTHLTYSMTQMHRLNGPCTDNDSNTFQLTVYCKLTCWMNSSPTLTMTHFNLQYDTDSQTEWALQGHRQWHISSYSMTQTHKLNESCMDISSDTFHVTVWQTHKLNESCKNIDSDAFQGTGWHRPTNWLSPARTLTVTHFMLQYTRPTNWMSPARTSSLTVTHFKLQDDTDPQTEWVLQGQRQWHISCYRMTQTQKLNEN